MAKLKQIKADGPFTNEEMVREALALIRDKVVIATIRLPRREPRKGLDSRPERIGGCRGVPQAAQDQPHHLLYQHRVDPNVPMEDVAGTVRA